MAIPLNPLGASGRRYESHSRHIQVPEPQCASDGRVTRRLPKRRRLAGDGCPSNRRARAAHGTLADHSERPLGPEAIHPIDIVLV